MAISFAFRGLCALDPIINVGSDISNRGQIAKRYASTELHSGGLRVGRREAGKDFVVICLDILITDPAAIRERLACLPSICSGGSRYWQYEKARSDCASQVRCVRPTIQIHAAEPDETNHRSDPLGRRHLISEHRPDASHALAFL